MKPYYIYARRGDGTPSPAPRIGGDRRQATLRCSVCRSIPTPHGRFPTAPSRLLSLTCALAWFVLSGGLIALAGCAVSLSNIEERGARAASGLPDGVTVIEPYEGKYSADARLVPAMEHLARTLPLAVVRMSKRLGGIGVALPPITIRVIDAEKTPMAGFAHASVWRTDGNDVGVVILAAEGLVTESYDLEGTLTHECFHILHMRCLGASVDRVPMWLREGMARWVELEHDGDVEARMLSYLLHGSGESVEPPLSMLQAEGTMKDSDLHAHDAAGTAFFFAMERDKGADFVRGLMHKLLHGEDWRTTMEAEFGETFPEILVRTRHAYGVWKESMQKSGDTLTDAGRKCESGDYNGADRDVGILLSDISPPAFRPWAERVKWFSQWYSGDIVAAKALIHVFRVKYPHSSLLTESWLDELDILRQERRWSELTEIATSVLRDYLWQPERLNQRRQVEDTLVEARSAVGR